VRPLAIFAAWVAGGLVTAFGGLWTMRRVVDHYRYRPVADLALSREVVRIGLPNYALTLAERAPGFVLPVIVVELLSPADNAAWYAAWMMAWVVFIIPIQIGMTSFAEISAPERTAKIVRDGIRTSLGLGAWGHCWSPLAGLSWACSVRHTWLPPKRRCDPAHRLLAPDVHLAYFSLCRARRRLREASSFAIDAAASILVPTLVAPTAGLLGMASPGWWSMVVALWRSSVCGS
jgi:hypothetical protein